MPATGPKLRQTCDTCRKAKVKCDRALPVCGRCITSGASCDYGVSNQGGRWRNGEKLGSQGSGKEPAASTANPIPKYEPLSYRDAIMSPLSISSSTDELWQMYQRDYLDCESICPPGPYQYFTAPPTPQSSQNLYSLSSLGPSDPGGHYQQFGEVHNNSMSSSTPGPSGPCHCMASMLHLLQNLYQRSSSNLPPGGNIVSMSCATVLDQNEEVASQCNTTLNCTSCSADSSSELFIIISMLIRKTISSAQAWATIPGLSGHNGMAQSRESLINSGSGQNDERSLRRDVFLIGVTKMEDLLPRLTEAGQALKGDYDRLACSALKAALSAQLRAAQEAMNTA